MKKKKVLNVHFEWYHITLGVFVLGVVVGALYTNIFLSEHTAQYSVLYESIITKMNGFEVRKVELFNYVIRNRLKFFLFIWCIGFVAFAKQINCIVTMYLGFSIGTLLSLAYIAKGIKGYCFVILLHVPHYLIYVPAYIYVIWSNQRFSKKMYGPKGHRGKLNVTGQGILEYALVFGMIVLLTMLGSFLESYVNIEVLKWYR